MNKKYDLTQGGIVSKLLLVALPIMGTQFLQMTYNLTDMFWLGRVGSDAVAASGTAGTYMWLANGILMIGRMGAEIGVSQNLGKGDREGARRFSENALLISLYIALVTGAAMILLRDPLIGFFNIQEVHVAQDASDYLAIVGLAIPFTFMTGALTGTFNGAGNSRVPFYINFIGLGINMVLDPVLILTLGLGIKGAAIATGLAQAIVCLAFIAMIKSGPGKPFVAYRIFDKLERARVRQIFRWSAPIAVESVLFTVLSMVISRFVAAWGADAIAVQRVSSQIESLSWLVGGGFASAVTAFIGQNYGAKKWSRIQQGFHVSTLMMGAWGVMVTMVLFFGARFLFSLFLPNPEILETGVLFLRILSACQFIACLEFLAAGVFRGLGKTIPPSIVSVTGNTIRIPVAYALSQTSLGLAGICWGVTFGATLRGIWLFAWCYLHFRKTPKADENQLSSPEMEST